MDKDKKIYIIIRNDDLCALSDAGKERRVLEIFEKYGVPQTFGVIPNMTEDPHNCQLDRFHPLSENRAIIDLIKEYRGKGLVEAAQHGYTHQTDAGHPSRGCELTEDSWSQGIDRKWLAFDPANPEWYSEFNGLAPAEQHRRILAGKEIIANVLGEEPRSFIFPWDSANSVALRILEDHGFENVLCSYLPFVAEKLNVIGYVDGEMFKLPDHLQEMSSRNKPVLTQVAYHSWMLSEEQLVQLDEMLKGLCARVDICFVTAQQAAEIFPAMKAVLDLKTRTVELTKQTNLYLANKADLPGYYVMDLSYYQLKRAVVWSKLIFVKNIGYRKAGLICSLVFVLYLIFLLSFPGVQTGAVQVALLVLMSMAAALLIKKSVKNLSQEIQ